MTKLNKKDLLEMRIRTLSQAGNRKFKERLAMMAELKGSTLKDRICDYERKKERLEEVVKNSLIGSLKDCVSL